MGGGEARALKEKDQLEQGQEVVSSGSQASISTRGWSKPEDQKVGTGLRSCQESGLNSEDDGAAAGLEESACQSTLFHQAHRSGSPWGRHFSAHPQQLGGAA